jgi:hypothetical protein
MAHSNAGHQACSQPGNMECGGMRERSSSSCGAGGGLRQGSLEDIKAYFLLTV